MFTTRRYVSLKIAITTDEREGHKNGLKQSTYKEQRKVPEKKNDATIFFFLQRSETCVGYLPWSGIPK